MGNSSKVSLKCRASWVIDDVIPRKQEKNFPIEGLTPFELLRKITTLIDFYF
jgi:hypothetical protein